MSAAPNLLQIDLGDRRLADEDKAELLAALETMLGQWTIENVDEMWRPMNQTEAAAWLGIDRATLSLWTCQVEDPVPHVYLGAKPRYRKADLTRWLDGRREKVAAS